LLLYGITAQTPHKIRGSRTALPEEKKSGRVRAAKRALTNYRQALSLKREPLEQKKLLTTPKFFWRSDVRDGRHGIDAVEYGV